MCVTSLSEEEYKFQEQGIRGEMCEIGWISSLSCSCVVAVDKKVPSDSCNRYCYLKTSWLPIPFSITVILKLFLH